MGTLTANQARLPEYCDHKLPTSCRLTSISNCCACADERAHAASYSTYIDGIGFVPRGNRWQRYCWFCKEFWEKRVSVSGLRPAQTKIPEVPDQSDFLARWYEFHQGYRLVRKEDGSEEKVAVLGEEFSEVSPGCLPRTLEELRSGRERAEEVQTTREEAEEQPAEAFPSLEDELDQMFQAATAEEDGGRAPQNGSTPQSEETLPAQSVQQQPRDEPQVAPPSTVHAQAMVPTGARGREYQARRIAGLRRELHRMRNGIERVISGLRELGEHVPDHTEATDRLAQLGNTLDYMSGTPSREAAQLAIRSVNALTNSHATSNTDRTLANMQARVDEARNHLNEARSIRDQATRELDLANVELRASQARLEQLQREQRTTENYMRIFGTREEMLAQGDSYESPIGSMFTRAYERFRAAEEVRRESQTLQRVLEDEQQGGEEAATRLAELENRGRDVWGVPRSPAEQEPPSATPGRRRIGPISRRSRQAREARFATNRPEPIAGEDGQDSELVEYYAMLRRQGWNQQASREGSENTTRNNNSPRNMLDAIVHARESARSERNTLQDSEPEIVERSQPAELSAIREPDHATQPEAAEQLQASEQHPSNLQPLHTLSPRFYEDWWHSDAVHVLSALPEYEGLRERHSLSFRDISSLSRNLQLSDMLSESDRTLIDSLLDDPSVIWGTRLPAEWLQRRIAATDAGEGLYFSGSTPGIPDSQAHSFAAHHNSHLQIEVLAQCFQRSSVIRRRAHTLSPPERLQMLYRLQAGERNEHDRTVLSALQEETDTGDMVRQMREHLGYVEDSITAQRRQIVEQERREMARAGDHSRAELDASRRAARDFALAAGRHAMQTGPQALMESAADRDEGTRAAYNRLVASGFSLRNRQAGTLYRQLALDDYIISPSDTDEESTTTSDKDVEERGLDAQDSGRPEPKSEEELMMSMECKICYTQTAEIACLPCGHLVMCRWCSEQHSPGLVGDGGNGRPRRPAGCPVCRKAIRQKVRVYR